MHDVMRLAVSDWHLHDGEDCRADIAQVHAWIAAWVPRCRHELLLLGDIAELQTASRGSGLRATLPVMLHVLDALPPTARLVYAAGNHDEYLGEVLRGYGRVVCHDRGRTLHQSGPLLHYTHGDQWDRWAWSFDALDWVGWQGGPSVGRLARKVDRRVGRDNGGVEYHRRRAQAALADLPYGSTLLHGHTHAPALISASGRTLIDLGSATRGGIDFATQDTEGKWTLRRLD